MYIHIHRDIECSKCKSVTNFEDTTTSRGNYSRTVRKCLNPTCNHEKVISETTASSSLPLTGSAQSIGPIYRAINTEQF